MNSVLIVLLSNFINFFHVVNTQSNMREPGSPSNFFPFQYIDFIFTVTNDMMIVSWGKMKSSSPFSTVWYVSVSVHRICEKLYFIQFSFIRFPFQWFVFGQFRSGEDVFRVVSLYPYGALIQITLWSFLTV